ncbi:MAG TPA: TRAP transporter small permease [Burkholderiaceae bacterium]|jgi:TRAP-type C4-dicarboxylate transport system permease small subunit|nr:TRAP transporter small permease [Burkholderiaceae bacterium]
MARLFDLSGRAASALARLTMALLALIVLLVSADVLSRNLGYSLVWGASLTEYLLVYVTFLPMPELVRGKGHVCADFLRRALPVSVRRAVERIVYAACVAICAYLGAVALGSLVETLRSGAYEVRTFDMPRWLIYLPMVIGLWLSAIEFMRYLFGRDSLYDADPAAAEGF